MSTETTAQNQKEDGNFKMAQNFKLTETKEIRATAMNKADICRELYNAAEFHLFGAGSWPADREASVSFHRLLDDLGLMTAVPDKPGMIQCTHLGLELNVELMSIFAGAVGLWDIPLVLDLMGYLDDDEADAIYTVKSKHPERVIRQHVRQIYFKFCNRSRYFN
jgi:hypothetical protein